MRHQDQYAGLFPTVGHPLFQLNESVQRLREEHELLQLEMNELYHTAKRIADKSMTTIDGAPLRKLKAKAAAFKKELDEHARWEEETLFPMVAWYYGEEMHQFTLIEQDHEIAEQFIQAFLDAIERAPVRSHDAHEMASYLLQAITAAGSHFEREEEIIAALMDRSNAYGY